MGLSVLSLLIIAFGAFFMRAQHSGVPDRITIEQCRPHSGYRISDHLLNFVMGDFCLGQPNTRERRVEFFGVYRKDVGHTVDVHITRGIGDTDEAVADAWIVPPIAVGVGCVLGAAAVIGIVRRLGPAPVAADSTGKPWPGANG